jgi:hypothetical protein
MHYIENRQDIISKIRGRTQQPQLALKILVNVRLAAESVLGCDQQFGLFHDQVMAVIGGDDEQ